MGDKCYYNKDTSIFGPKDKATEFQCIFEVNQLVKGIKVYHHLTGLSTECCYYKIKVNDSEFFIDHIWSTRKEAIKVCEKLNLGIHEQIFIIEEIVHDDQDKAITV